MEAYIKTYGIYPGVPQILVSNRTIFLGRNDVVNAETFLSMLDYNPCPLLNGSSIDFTSLNFNELPAKPKIWVNDKVIVPGSQKLNQSLLLEIIVAHDVEDLLKRKGVAYTSIQPSPMEISHGKINFGKAIMVGDWLVEWGIENATPATSTSWKSYLVIFLILFMLVVFFFGKELYKKKKKS